MINVFTETITPRIEFIFNLIFGNIGGNQVDFFTNENLFAEASGTKINYSKKNIAHCFWCFPVDLLFEDNIKKQQPEVEEYQNFKYFFKTKQGELFFDVFAASFYLATRYEEYESKNRDQLDRFLPEHSLAFKHGFLEEPIIHIWASYLFEKINQSIQGANLKSITSYSIQASVDVDTVFYFKTKNIFQQIGGGIKDLLRFNYSEFITRLQVCFGLKPDPLEVIEKLKKIAAIHKAEFLVFVLMGNNLHYDKSASVKNKEVRKQINLLSQYFNVGLHPSVKSHLNQTTVQAELNTLEEIIQKKVTFSRQHYLTLSLPETYTKLLNAGINNDYSMGYPQLLGFRSGLAVPYSFFDLLKNKTTSLIIHPFCAMDATSNFYLKQSTNEALQAFKKLSQKCEKHQVPFHVIFHFDVLSNFGLWQGWQNFMSDFLKTP